MAASSDRSSAVREQQRLDLRRREEPAAALVRQRRGEFTYERGGFVPRRLRRLVVAECVRGLPERGARAPARRRADERIRDRDSRPQRLERLVLAAHTRERLAPKRQRARLVLPSVRAPRCGEGSLGPLTRGLGIAGCELE